MANWSEWDSCRCLQRGIESTGWASKLCICDKWVMSWIICPFTAKSMVTENTPTWFLQKLHLQENVREKKFVVCDHEHGNTGRFSGVGIERDCKLLYITSSEKEILIMAKQLPSFEWADFVVYLNDHLIWFTFDCDFYITWSKFYHAMVTLPTLMLISKTVIGHTVGFIITIFMFLLYC